MAPKKIDFKTGDYVVYPTQGVGRLLRSEEMNIGGVPTKMLVIEFEKNNMTIRVPFDRVEISGLRPISSQKKIMDAIKSAKEKAAAKRMIWSRRAAMYEENINSGDPMKVAEVIRDLQRRSINDTPTFSGHQLYLRALDRMAQEFAAINGIELEEASDKIEEILEIPRDFEVPVEPEEPDEEEGTA